MWRKIPEEQMDLLQEPGWSLKGRRARVEEELRKQIINVEENAVLLIEESLELQRCIDADAPYPNPANFSREYLLGYSQGRKDAARVLMLSFKETWTGPTSDTT